MNDAAWTDEQLRDPHAAADKRDRVRRMFAAIAPKYDLNNRLHSFGMDQRWRRRAVALSEIAGTETVIDVACGTGDLSLAFVDRLTMKGEVAELAAHVIGIDFTYEMLPRARAKWFDDGMVVEHQDEDFYEPIVRDIPQWVHADATALPLADASADVVSIAFGLRNVQEPRRALAEFHRVLRPGGRVIVLEFSKSTNPAIRWLNDFYCNRIMPRTATWISGDTSGAYKYLPMSVDTFVTREGMTRMIADAGFAGVTQHPMTFGVAVVYRGYKR